LILRACFLAAIILLSAETEYAGTFNHEIRWSEEEFQRAKHYAKRYHVSWPLIIALRKAENGKTKAYGQESISSEIKELDLKEEWQMAQAARTLSRAIISFVRDNPQFVAEYDWKPGEITWEGFLWEYRTRFVDHLAYVGWVPEDDPKTWASNVKFLWAQARRQYG